MKPLSWLVAEEGRRLTGLEIEGAFDIPVDLATIRRKRPPRVSNWRGANRSG
jgi:hypothetical protein